MPPMMDGNQAATSGQEGLQSRRKQAIGKGAFPTIQEARVAYDKCLLTFNMKPEKQIGICSSIGCG